MANTKIQKEITVKRISAFKFEVEVSVGMSSSEIASIGMDEGNAKEAEISHKSNEFALQDGSPQRISVIRRAPPSTTQIQDVRLNGKCDRGAGRLAYGPNGVADECHTIPAGVILIKDAILYRIIEILLWKVLGEDYLKYWGYPTAPTYRLLWKVVYYYSHVQTGVITSLKEDHDCQGDINCFMDHVGHFLELCAPTPEIKAKFGWLGLTREQILRKIYYEDLYPFLSKSDLTNYSNILASHKDILRLQKWQEEGFTAISWNGHEHFSRLRSRQPFCPECCRRLKKSVISN